MCEAELRRRLDSGLLVGVLAGGPHTHLNLRARLGALPKGTRRPRGRMIEVGLAQVSINTLCSSLHQLGIEHLLDDGAPCQAPLRAAAREAELAAARLFAGAPARPRAPPAAPPAAKPAAPPAHPVAAQLEAPAPVVGPFLRTHHAGGLSLGGLVIPDERRELILQPDFMDVFGDMGADVISLPAEDITVDYCRRALAHAEREHWSLERLLTGPEYDYLFGFDGYRERSMKDLATVPPDDKASFVFELQFCAFSVLDYHDLLMALGGDRLAEGGAAGAVAAAVEPAVLAAAPPPPAAGVAAPPAPPAADAVAAAAVPEALAAAPPFPAGGDAAPPAPPEKQRRKKRRKQGP